MAIIPKIALNAQTTCGYITVEDLVSYGATPDTREEFGILLLWSKDNWITIYEDTTNPGDTLNPSLWDIISIGNGTYEVEVYYVALYSEASTYSTDDICFYSGAWYVCTGSTGPIAFDPTKWTVYSFAAVDIDTSRTSLLVRYGNTPGANYFTSGNEVLSCVQEYQKVKLDCHSYRIYCDAQSNLGYDISVTVETYDGTLVSCTDVTDQTTEEFDITLTEDGVYIVTIGSYPCSNTATPSITEYTSFVIYDYCDIFTCFESLMLAVLCREFDPCCETCDEAVVQAMELRRLELNKMLALNISMISKIHIEATRYLGVYSIDEDRGDYIANVSDIIEKLKVITGRCGDCSGASEDPTSQCDEC